MSGDIQGNRNKSTKHKKRTNGAVESTPVIEDPQTMHPQLDKTDRSGEIEDVAESAVPSVISNDELAHSKKQKKDKKKKTKKAKEGAGAIIPFENNDSMNVDVTESSTPTESEEIRGEKTKKKRKRDDPSLVDTDKSDSRKEKRKKRKSMDGGQTEESNGVTTEEGKKEKRTKKILSTGDEAGTPSSIARLLPSKETVTAFLTKHSVTVNVPEGHSSSVPVLSFSQLSLPDGISKALEGFSEPTPIQACTWPYGMEGRDVVGIAETGSGKTLAFGIPALSQLIETGKHKTGGVSILVVAPTRELAIQTHETLSDLGKPFDIASVAVFGGVPKEGQRALLKKAGVAGGKAKKGGDPITKIVVGTPGRVLDLASEGVCDLSGVDYLVLDEADRMLDKGFENDIRRIIEQTRPKEERQTMMFSATWPEAVRRLASTFQRDPVRVTVGSDDLTANSRVEQTVEVFDDARTKDSRLLNLLKSLGHKRSGPNNRILIFALYKKEASRVELMLKHQGYTVGALHGDMSQTARMDALENFKNGVTGLLVATDVAARGLDIPDVEVVINYTFPLTIEDYIHRIGRTGRGGKSGKSITYFTGDNHERGLAGELARVLREGGFDYDALKKFPMTIKKKEHGAYGAFFRDDIPVPKGPTKIVF